MKIDELIGIIKELFKDIDIEITGKTELYNDLALSSLDMMLLVTKCEQNYKMNIEALAKATNVDELARAFEK